MPTLSFTDSVADLLKARNDLPKVPLYSKVLSDENSVHFSYVQLPFNVQFCLIFLVGY